MMAGALSYARHMIRLNSRMKPFRPARFALLSLWLGSSMLLAGCHGGDNLPLQLTQVTGHMPDLDFHLTDDSGKPVGAADYRGKLVLLYFGYTHCPDVCPLTLAHLHVVMQKLGPLADNVRILFVSVDPVRDTPAVLHTYANAFDTHTIGLTGSTSDIETLSKRYRSAFTREPGDADGSYEVSHSSAVYVFDQAGKARVLSTPADPQNGLIHDLRLLLGAGAAP
jgi:protein SCO1/2